MHNKADVHITVEPSAPAARDYRIDFWRGTCLVGMIAWHLLSHGSYPKWFSFPIIQLFNFVAEGFVLLAGAVIGLRWSRDAAIKVAPHVRRALEILLLHYGMVVALYLMGVTGGVTERVPSWRETGWGVLTLAIQPYLADVLTLFFFLFLSTPLWQWIYKVAGTGGLLLTSGLLYGITVHDPALVPINTAGAFDFGSWQLYYVLGLTFGIHYPVILKSIDAERVRWMIGLCLLLAIALAWRVLLQLDGSYARSLPNILGDSRKPLTLFRTIYILAQLLLLVVVTLQFWTRIADHVLARWIIYLGRNSLVVFVTSVFFDYLFKGLLSTYSVRFPYNLPLLLLELAIVSLAPTAFAFLSDLSFRRFRMGRPLARG
jgi:hypothetical protein